MKLPSAKEIAEETILNNTDAFLDVDFNKATLAIMMAMSKYYNEVKQFIEKYSNEKQDNEHS